MTQKMTIPFSRPSSRIQAVAPSATKLMAQRAAGIENCVSLGQGVPGFSPPPHVVQAVQKMLTDNPTISRYTLQNGMPELRERLSKYLQAEKGIGADPDHEICVTVGGMEALLASILAVVDPGDEVLLPSPTYASYTEQVLLAGGVPVFVPLNSEWGLDLTSLEASITKNTKAILLCNPGNPTGNVYSAAEIHALCALAVVNNIVLIIDEAYDYIVYGDTKILNPLSLDEYRNHVIAIGSLSKKYCLTGWRVGWVAAARQWMEHITKVHDAATICAPTISQCAALAALNGDQQWVATCCRKLAEKKEVCCSRLDRLTPHFSYVTPKGAFYVMAKYHFSSETSHQTANRLLDETGVITVPGGSFGQGGESHLRLSFGGETAEIHESFDRIERWLGV